MRAQLHEHENRPADQPGGAPANDGGGGPALGCGFVERVQDHRRPGAARDQPQHVEAPLRVADAATKIAIAIRNERFVPKRSEMKPAAGMKTARLSRYPVTVHSTWLVLALKSRLNCGTATFTTVVSMRSMKRPNMNTIATRYL